jgi:hypothetical protein
MVRAALILAVATALHGCIVTPGPGYRGNPGYGYADPNQQQCRMGSNGVQACGYSCRVGSDGIAACANAPGGQCSLGSDGRVYCSEAPMQQQYGAQPYGAPMPPAQCELNSDGSKTCGYNCHLGSNGYHYCASTPQGRCGLNSDGTWTCS